MTNDRDNYKISIFRKKKKKADILSFFSGLFYFRHGTHTHVLRYMVLSDYTVFISRRREF